MTLKTLKDIDFGCYQDKLCMDKLRQEAIRDIKAVWKGEMCGNDVVNYIKWKNNITDEDLKDGK